MGFAMVTLDAPVTKTSSSILAFQKDEAAEAKETACINCGRCVEVCPSRIIPSRLADLSERHNEEGFVKMNGLECVEWFLQFCLSGKKKSKTGDRFYEKDCTGKQKKVRK